MRACEFVSSVWRRESVPTDIQTFISPTLTRHTTVKKLLSVDNRSERLVISYKHCQVVDIQ